METNQFLVSQALDLWEGKIGELTDFFRSLNEEQTMLPIAPCKNKVVYILGHLLTMHDWLFEALEIGKRSFRDYDDLFLTPQHRENQYPGYQQLLDQFVGLNNDLLQRLRQLSVEDWLSKHHYISQVEFIEQPKRNRFNIFIGRMGHLFHHGGQLALIRPSECF